MRRASVILLLFLLLSFGTFYLYRNSLPSSPAPETPAPEDAAQTPPSGEQAMARPSFDIVRAEPSGELVMAGRAQPGWTVTVEDSGKVVGRAVADNNGDWVMEPSAPLAKGEHSLQLKAQSGAGGQTLFSKQRLALSLGDAGKSRPLVALTEEGQATRVLQMAPSAGDDKRGPVLAQGDAAGLQSAPGRPANTSTSEGSQVSFMSVDYEQAGDRSKIFINGRASPGSRVMVYIGDAFAGTATADISGSWTFQGSRQLGAGSHVMRADQVDIGTGKVLARAEVNFDRDTPGNIASNGAASSSGQRQAAIGAARPGTASSASTGGNPASPQAIPPGATTITIPTENGEEQVIIVRRGDSLWQIAQRHYGSGVKYTQIFQTNRTQIRNPNLIYPSQRFAMPR